MPGQMDEFGAGVNHAVNDVPHANLMSAGLQAAGSSWTSQVMNEAARPHSLLQPLYQNTLGNGMDQATADRRFPDGSLPGNYSGNGSSSDQVMPTAMPKMTSGDPEAD
jgi:hypothetical protein